MFKVFIISFFFCCICHKSYGQDQTFDNKIESQGIQDKFNNQSNTSTIDDEWDKTFKGLSHPLAITGGILTLGGVGLYVAGSEAQNNHNYQPQNKTQYLGIGAFATGAILFAIFSTERDENMPKRGKERKYNSSEWEIPQ